MSNWKVGRELAPFHPDASHVEPGYRDGWNACYAVAAAEIEKLRAAVTALAEIVQYKRVNLARYCEERGYAAEDEVELASFDKALKLADEALGNGAEREA